MTVYILMIDGSCFKEESDSILQAINNLSNKFFDQEDIFDEINMIEWKDSNNRNIRNYSTGRTDTFPIDTEFKLKDFLKIKRTKKPTKELAEEFEI